MTVTEFWNIIDQARRQAGGWEEMQQPLIESLARLETEEIFLWDQIFGEYQTLSYKEKLWAAAYVINGGCSDDGFDYFRGWLTAQGRQIFHGALQDPDSLADMECCAQDVGYEDILGAALLAYFLKTKAGGRSYEEYFSDRAERRHYGEYYRQREEHPLPKEIKEEIAGGIRYGEGIDKEWDEDELEELLPKLCEAFEW